MSQFNFKNVLGRRTVATEGAAFVTLETTNGNFKMGSELSAILGVSDGDALAVQQDENSGTYFIGKGLNGTPDLDAEGKEQVDARGRIVYVEGKEPFGATVRNINEGGAYQRFSAAAAWADLGGSNDVKKVFELGEPVDATLDTESDHGTFSTTLYPLVFVKDEEKIVRETKKVADDTAKDNAEAPVDAPSDAGAQVDPEFASPSDFADEEL